MLSNQVMNLINQLLEKKVWCSVKVVIQKGCIEVIEVTQTIKHQATEKELAVIVKTE